MKALLPDHSELQTDTAMTERAPLLEKLKRPLLAIFFAGCLWRGWVSRMDALQGAMARSYFDVFAVPLANMPGGPFAGKPFGEAQRWLDATLRLAVFGGSCKWLDTTLRLAAFGGSCLFGTAQPLAVSLDEVSGAGGVSTV
eukprot:NODE_29711_length_438_cov_1.520900.p1 GENE.NODE_29711_length_438_cov_1.520900~~NODE_29711_length_438_cov_1.520900.p1  ORF type:complete len:141 (-),score=36.06 NODE_29711_length_438_cov_1.520900:16-438(-)